MKIFFQDDVIDNEEHSKALQNPQSEMEALKSNNVPKNVVILEKLFDLQDRIKKPANVKTNNSSM